MLVRWHDAWFDFDSGGGWADGYVVETVGWLLRDEHVITLAAERLPDGGWRAITHVPRQSLVEMVRLSSQVAGEDERPVL